MSIQFTVPLTKLISAMKLEVAYMPPKEEEILISSADINRPGLQLAGFFDYFDNQRVQLIGKSEIGYLSQLTPEQEEEERATRERLRLVDRAYALSKQVEKILPPDIFGGWAEVKQSLPVVLEVYVVDQAAASEILESYADPEIPFSYSIVKFSKSEMDAMIADLWEEEIIQKNKDKIYDISPDYWVADGYIEIDLFEPWPELNAWLEGYTSAAEITINDGTKEKTNPA